MSTSPLVISGKPVISRKWAMPSSETFGIGPIAALLDRWLDGRAVVVDPFARDAKRGSRLLTNDLSPDTSAHCHLPAEKFLAYLLEEGIQADAILLDPPYSPRQIKDCYQSIGMPVDQCATQHSRLISSVKDLAGRLIQPGGIAICCGWNSAGMGKGRGFKLREILLVNHGGSHNDTIVTVEEKMPGLFDESEAA